MVIRYIFILCVLFKWCAIEASIIKEELLQVSLITRHGQRTPEMFFPLDPWKSSYHWPEGIMQLTAEGSRQLKDLGEFLRRRYALFLPIIYKNKDVLVRSTEKERTIYSAASLLSGLYPNQSVPIIVYPDNCSSIFHLIKYCPALDEELEKQKHSEEFIDEEKQKQPLYTWLSPKLGLTINDSEHIEYLYTNFVIEEQRNMALPDWSNKIYPEPIRGIAGKYIGRFGATTLTQRLTCGPFINDILQNAVEAGNNSHLLNIYSVHDVNIAGILKTMNAYSGYPPEFAAMLLFEIHQNKTTKEKTIKFFYKNGFKEDLNPLDVPGCGYSCLLNSFIEFMQPIIPGNITEECFAGTNFEVIDPVEVQITSYIFIVIIMGILSCTLTLGLTVIFCNIFNYRRRHTYTRIG